MKLRQNPEKVAARKAEREAKRGVAPKGLTYDADRFSVQVSENLTGVGARSAREPLGLKYRVIVTDDTTRVTQHVGYGISYRMAEAEGRKYIDKLCSGKKRLRI